MLSKRPNDDSGMEFHCVTCADEALPATVLSMDQETGLALVQLENEKVEVDISLVDTLLLGDTVMVHGGVALANLGAGNQSE